MKIQLKLIAALLILFSGTACVLVQRDKKTDQLNTLLLLYLLTENAKNKVDTTANPTVTMTNNSGGTESYFLFTNSGCTGTATYEFSNPVSNGSTTAALTIGAGGYYVSIFGILCTSSTISFENGLAYACSSDGANITCTSSAL